MKENPGNDLVFHHCIPIQTRFSDVDPLGHVNNSVLFQYFDTGRIHYFQDVMQNVVTWNEIPLVLVHLSTDFLAPAFFDANLVVETKTLGFGKKSLKMIQRLKDKDTGDVKSVCRAILSGFDPKTNTSLVIPESLKQTFLNYEQKGEE